jgi:integral membrane sensor domain MASE1
MAGVLRDANIRRSTAAGLRILAVAAAYFVGGRIGLLEQVTVGGVQVTACWPPTGIALTCLLLMGLRVWPGIALGTLLVIAAISPLTPASFAIAAGNTLAPVCSVLLLRRAGFRTELDRLKDGVSLVFLGALIGMLISATVATVALVVAGSLPAEDFWVTWLAWWTGDAMGVLVVTPLLLAVRRFRPPHDVPLYRWAEPVVLLAGVAAVTLLGTRSTLHLLFLVFPLLMWAALRFQLIGAAPCVLLVSVISVIAARDQVGPFEAHELFATMVTLQALNGSAALTALLLSAVVAERESTYLKIEQACIGLAEVVARLAPGTGTPGTPPAADGPAGPGRGTT